MPRYYIEFPITTDRASLQESARDSIESQVPGYELAPGEPTTWVIEATADMAAEQAEVASQVPSGIFSYIGTELFGVPYQSAVPAKTLTTWTFSDGDGHVIPAGTSVLLDGVAFVTTTEVVVLPGVSATELGAVEVEAVEEGAVGNGLGLDIQPADALAYIDRITAVGLTSGGVDAEDDDTYRDRLASRLALLADHLVTAEDFAHAAEQNPGVARAVALDGYNPQHNLLTLNQSSFETDTTGWALSGTGVGAAISRITTMAAHGAASLQITGGGAVDTTSAQTDPIDVTPGTQYTATAEVRGNSAANPAYIQIRWLQADGTTLISTSSGVTSDDSLTAWQQRFVTAVAPPGAVKARVRVTFGTVANPASGETNLVDKVAFREGYSTDWVVGGTPANGNERMIHVVPIDDAGQPVSSTIKAELDAEFQAKREVNFVVTIGDPTYFTVAVRFNVVALPNYDTAAVQANVMAALSDYLDPANWGGPKAADEEYTWRASTVVRYLEVAQIINNADGVDYITSLTLNGGTTDVTISGGAAPLPAGDVTVNVTGNTTSGSVNVTNVLPDTFGLRVGMLVTGPGIPAGTTIAAIFNGGTTFNFSQAATATAAGVAMAATNISGTVVAAT